jgi:hypothetical protein
VARRVRALAASLVAAIVVAIVVEDGAAIGAASAEHRAGPCAPFAAPITAALPRVITTARAGRGNRAPRRARVRRFMVWLLSRVAPTASDLV